MCNAFSGDSEHERDGGSESKVVHRCPFAVGACFAVPLFIHPGIFQVISQPGRGKVIVAIPVSYTHLTLPTILRV